MDLYWGIDEKGEIHLLPDVTLHKRDLYAKGYTFCGIRLRTWSAPLMEHGPTVFGKKDAEEKATCEECNKKYNSKLREVYKGA